MISDLKAKFLKKHDLKIRRATTKYKITSIAFVAAFNKELEKVLFEQIDAELSTIWVRNLELLVRKMNNTKSLLRGRNPKDAINQKNVELVVDEEY